MKRWRSILIFATVAAIGGGAFVAWRVWPRRRVFVTDARDIRTPEASAGVRDILWDVPKPADHILRLTDGSTDYAMDAEARRLVFVRGDGASSDVFTRTRTGGDWGSAAPLDAINSEHADFDVSLSGDGRTIVFASDRPGALGGSDLYISRFSSGAWGPPAPVQIANSPSDEIGPAVSPHGTRLFFASDRDEIVDRPTDASPDHAAPDSTDAIVAAADDFNLYWVDLLSDAPPQAISEANTPAQELSPALSPGADFLYLASDRRGGAGRFDLYRIRLLGNAFGAMEHLDDGVNTAGDELDPYLTLGGFTLTYRSAASDEDGDAPTAARLMQSTSREVFRDVTYLRGRIDWAGLWRQIAPNLLWALLALLLTLLFLAMMRDFRDRKIGLLARCLLVSLLAHLVLMLLFNVLKVSTTIASAIGGRDRLRVSLLSQASAGEIGNQIRGEFVDVRTAATEVARAERPALDVPPREPRANVEMTPGAVELPHESHADVQLPDLETSDAPAEIAAPRHRATDSSAMPPASFADVTLREVATPDAASAATQSERAVPAGLAAVGDVALDSAVAVARVPTTQPARARTTDLGIAATASMPMDTPHDYSPPAPSDAGTVDAPRQRFAPVSLAALSDAGTGGFEVEIALPGSNEAASGSGSEVGLKVAAVEIASPAHVPLAKLTRRGGDIVEMSVARGTTPDDAGSSSVARVDVDRDATVKMSPKSSTASPSMFPDVAATPIELAVAMPAAPERASKDRGDGAAIDTSLPVSVSDAASARTGLPSASEALARSQRGSISLAVIAPESETGWVTSGANPISEKSDGVEGADSQPASTIPGARVAVAPPTDPAPLALGIPKAPPSRPRGIRRGAIGRIAGRVEDVDTGRTLASARILLALPRGQSIIAETDRRGRYEIQVPKVPDHFALSASHAGYVPESLNIAERRVRGRTITVNFALERQTELVIALEAEPDVHHLGNDRFQGRINSQFQRQTEGRTFRASFVVSRDQLPPNFTRAEVRILAKGVQCPHQVRINGRLLSKRLAKSPRDGSFGEYRAEFDAGWLIEGKNKFKIRARSCGGDLDDFEFVNVRIMLQP